MEHIGKLLATPSSCYSGERPDWLNVVGQHRDSDALARSNFRVISADLMGRFGDVDVDDSGMVAVERFRHWAVGWVEELLVAPGSSAADAAQAWLDKLEGYPVADDEDFSALEYEESWESITEFVRATWPRLSDDAPAVADWICTQDWPETIGMDYGIGWPDLRDSRYRSLVAAGLRDWRRHRASSKEE